MHVVKKVVAICFWSVEFLEDFRRISGVEKKEVPARTKKKEARSLGWTPYLCAVKERLKSNEELQ